MMYDSVSLLVIILLNLEDALFKKPLMQITVAVLALVSLV